MSVTSEHSHVKDTQLMTGTLLPACCLIRTVRNEDQATFGVLLCANESPKSSMSNTTFTLEFCHTLQQHTPVPCLAPRKPSRM